MSYRPPFYKRYPQDFLSSDTVRKMSLSEKGIYNTLLDTAWMEDPTATLPKDLNVLSRITGIDRRILSRFTVKYPGVFREFPGDAQRTYNPRLKAEFDEFLQICEQRRLAGVESGRARRQKRTDAEQVLTSQKLDTDTEKEEDKRQDHQSDDAVSSPTPLLEQARKALLRKHPAEAPFIEAGLQIVEVNAYNSGCKPASANYYITAYENLRESERDWQTVEWHAQHPESSDQLRLFNSLILKAEAESKKTGRGVIECFHDLRQDPHCYDAIPRVTVFPY